MTDIILYKGRIPLISVEPFNSTLYECHPCRDRGDHIFNSRKNKIIVIILCQCHLASLMRRYWLESFCAIRQMLAC